jgi:hypothetical protein
MPWWFKPAALTQLGSPKPYSQIEAAINRDAVIVLLATLAALAATILKFLGVI